MWPTYSSSLPTPLAQTCGCLRDQSTLAKPTSRGSSLPVSRTPLGVLCLLSNCFHDVMLTLSSFTANGVRGGVWNTHRQCVTPSHHQGLCNGCAVLTVITRERGGCHCLQRHMRLYEGRRNTVNYIHTLARVCSNPLMKNCNTRTSVSCYAFYGQMFLTWHAGEGQSLCSREGIFSVEPKKKKKYTRETSSFRDVSRSKGT